MGGADGSAAPTRSPLAEWLLRNRKSRVPTDEGDGAGASSLKLDAAMRLLRVGGARDQSASPGAEPVGHVVRRVQRSAKEQREEAALEADRAERERIRRVVTEADEAETAERRRLRDQARLVCRAAKTARMIETHEASEARRAERAAARAREETLATWRLEEEAFLAHARDATELEREPRPEPRPKAPTRPPPSPRRSFTDATSRVRRSRRAGGVVCVTPVDTTGRAVRADSAPARARRGGPANGVASERYRAGCRAGCRDGCRPETCDARGDQAAARVRDAARGRGVVRANAEGSQGGDDRNCRWRDAVSRSFQT